MPLAAGAKPGPYEVLPPIGAGGMGEVYKARYTRLDPVVAIKVPAGPFSECFEREALRCAIQIAGALDAAQMSVPVSSDPAFRAGTPVPLFELSCGWDVRADGQRFLAAVPSRTVVAEPLQLVLNWIAALPAHK